MEFPTLGKEKSQKQKQKEIEPKGAEEPGIYDCCVVFYRYSDHGSLDTFIFISFPFHAKSDDQSDYTAFEELYKCNYNKGKYHTSIFK